MEEKNEDEHKKQWQDISSNLTKVLEEDVKSVNEDEVVIRPAKSENTESCSPPPGLNQNTLSSKEILSNNIRLKLLQQHGIGGNQQQKKLGNNRHSIASLNELANSNIINNNNGDNSRQLLNNVVDNKLQNRQSTLSYSMQVDHLMHLLSERLCILEESSSSIDKKLDMYEFHCRKKLEDCREQLRRRIDELVESYARQITFTVKSRRKFLQVLERSVEDHLGTTQSALTQSKLKLNNRPHLSNADLHNINNMLLDCLVKTKKLQREASEFNYWLDFIPKDPLEDDHCIGSILYNEYEEPIVENHCDKWKMSTDSTDLKQPNKFVSTSPAASGPSNNLINRIDSIPCLTRRDFLNNTSIPSTKMTSQSNRRNSWHPALQIESNEDQTNNRRAWNTTMAVRQFPLKSNLVYQQLLTTVPINKTCIHVLSSNATSTADDVIRRQNRKTAPPINRMSMAGTAVSSLLTLDMQRPLVVDCYGDPPRHLKCIKGLVFMAPNKMLICENGRRAGHKNILTFSMNGKKIIFMDYVNPSNYTFINPTGLCIMQHSETSSERNLVVVDQTQLMLIDLQTNQISTTLELDKESSSNHRESTAFHRQDQYGGMCAVDNVVYLCDRKSSSVLTFDVRTNKITNRWTNPDIINPNFAYHRSGGFIYVSDSASNKVIKLDSNADGKQVGELSCQTATKKGLFNNPSGMCDDGDILAVADLYNNRLQLFSKDNLVGSIYSPFIESPFGISYHPMGVLAVSNGRPRTVTLYFTMIS